ncbi:MAG: hypothetical protein MMC33_003343 [Icmadophila ericetorum]|nr:hypothetical protein [Icmadophila ericetorum]
MSAGPSSLGEALAKQITLYVLSPSTEVPNRLTFPDTPVSTTIGELKQKIQEIVATKPAPERQRLIYRARPLVQDSATLEDVFGREAIANSDALSLHLVLPPPNAPNLDSSNHAPPRQTHATHPLIPQRPASTGQLPVGDGARAHMGPVNMGRGGPGFLPNNMLPPWQMPPIAPGQLFPGMQEALNNHFTALGQGAQLGTAPPGASAGLPPARTPPGARQQMPIPSNPLQFQQFLAQQQQTRAAARQHGLANAATDQNPSRTASAPPPEIARSGTPGQTTNNPTQGPNNTNTIVHEGHGPNGSHWRMVINQTIGGLPLADRLAQHRAHHNGGQAPVPAPIGGNIPGSIFPHNSLLNMQHVGHDAQTNIHTGGQANDQPTSHTFSRPDNLLVQDRDSESGNSNLEQAALGVIMALTYAEQMLMRGEVPSETEATTLEAHWNMFRSAIIPGGPRSQSRLYQSLNLRYYDTQYAIAQARRRALLGSNSTPVVSPTGASSQVPSNTQQPSLPSTVYLLSSPSGPQALLLSPSGMYSTPGLNASRNPFLPLVPQPRLLPNQGQVMNPADGGEGQPLVGGQLEEQQRPGRIFRLVQHAREPGRNDEVRDLMRILLPLGGHLWLIIRLFGFVYFFTAGAGWRRAIMLGICAALVFIAQTGALRPLQQAVWDPLRRHVEGLVPLGVNDRAAELNPNRGGVEGQARIDAPLDPRDVADRLVRERQAQNGSVVQRNLRRAERAVALFIASLVPGVGERHVAATEAAEAARQAEEREREARARREEEERVQREESEAAAAASSDEHFTDTEETQREQGGSAHQPVVEI